uniref:Uncharacterized protein n=1 Tax=Photinus pyralis TaxID=7054 RepID=A0A1Y1LG23_PHOPY
MTDEMEAYGPGSRIVEFVSGGRKNYAYKVFSTDKNKYITVCKAKGITLANSQIINFDSLKELVLNNAEPLYAHTDRKIDRTATHDVVSKSESKIYQVQYNKRRRLDGCYDTLSYGYAARAS